MGSLILASTASHSLPPQLDPTGLATWTAVVAAGGDTHAAVRLNSGATLLLGATPRGLLYASYEWCSAALGVMFAVDGDLIQPQAEVRAVVKREGERRGLY